LTISVTKLLRFLFGAAVVLMPFNALPYFKGIFGELSGEGSFYPFLMAILVWIICMFLNESKIHIPKDLSFYLIVFFGLWAVVSGMVNLPQIIYSSTKGRTGLEKILLQYFVFIFTMIVSICIYNIFRKDDNVLLYLRRLCLISFLIAGLYSSLEILFLLGNAWSADMLNSINSLFRDTSSDSLLYFGRLRSVSGEASWFGMYLSFAMPWTLSYLVTEKRKLPYVLLNMYFLILLILTISRTAYVICGIQIILFSMFFCKTKFVRNKSVLVYAFLGLIGLIMFFQNTPDTILNDKNILDIFLSLLNNDDSPYNLSNIARFGSQTAAINMFLSHPIFGVGLGQYGFHMPEFVPDWAYKSEEIILWASGSPDTPWPPVHGLYARILAEVGFFGLAIWLFLWGRILFKLINYSKFLSNIDEIMIKSLFISIIGVLLSGFNSDSFRFFGYWILMGISWCCISAYDALYSRRSL